jgi:beta-glucosidase
MPGRRPSIRRRIVAAAAVAIAFLGVGAVATGPAAVATVGPLPNVEDFEGNTQIGTGNPGIFSFGADAQHTPQLQIVDAPNAAGEGADNHALDMPYDVTGYGGFTEDLATAQDWSNYGGLSFWVKGSNTGQRIEYEIKDGGTDGEHSELWQGFFTDDSTGWKQITEPFNDLVIRTDYQPTGGPINGTLDLTSMWGYAVNVPANVQGDLTFDDFAVYGTAAPKPPVVSTPKPVYLVDDGDTAHVPVTVTTTHGDPTAAPVTVDWTLDDGTATAGTDYTDDSGTLTFPAETPSGTSQSIDVQTLSTTTPSESKTLAVTLTPHDATMAGPSPTVVINAHGLAYLDKSLPVADRVADLMSRMSLAEKVGQMAQAERANVGDGSKITTDLLGSVLSGGGSTPAQNTPTAWADMVDGYQLRALATPLQIPIIYGIDSVHGDNNLAGATLFPHNVGMGATRDPHLAREEGKIAATETRATGIPWVFAPCVCVTRDDRWGRAYESYGEDPALVSKMETFIKGLQGNDHLSRKSAVLATAKHFLGDGGTKYGSSSTGTYTIDQGITYVTRKQLDDLYVGPYKTAIADHVGSVMPSYSSLQILGHDSAPVKMHARRDMITGLLKKKLGFTGFVISDYNAIDQIGSDYKNDVKTSINAGLDMIMAPSEYETFESDLISLVNSGDVSHARINGAVRRILTQKFALGLFDHPFANRSNADTIGSSAHRAVARQAAAESQVLLKNAGGILPLAKSGKIYVAGSNADDEGNQTGGWTLTWQGQSGDIPGATSILSGMEQDAPHATITYSKDASASMTGYHLGVVVVGETPYAEGVGDIGNGHTLQLSVADRDAVDKVCGAMKCVVLDVSGRPLDITGVVPEADAVVASWLPGSEGEGVADTLFGKRPFTGRLPVSWFKAESQIPINVGDKHYDPLYPYGWGLRTDSVRSRLSAVLADLRATGGTGDAQQALRPALKANKPADVLAAVQRAADLMSGSRYTWTEQNLLASVARDYAQRAIVSHGAMSRAAATTADAESTLLRGNVARAVRLLDQARTAARTTASARSAKSSSSASAGPRHVF